MKTKPFYPLQVQIPFQVFKSSSLNKAKQGYTPFFTLLHMVWQALVVLELVNFFSWLRTTQFVAPVKLASFLFSYIFTG